MSKLPRNINGILGTILFHLIVVVICLACKINTLQKSAETYIIIEPQQFDEQDKETAFEESENSMTDAEIAEYMENLGLVGSNYSGNISQSSSMSLAEIQSQYEEAFLKEKYGADYEAVTTATYEDFIDETRMQQHKENEKQRNVVKAGPALVYAELENPQREVSYLKVPVFTCEGSGIVVIGITISSSGRVEAAEVLSSQLTSDEECLLNSAKNAAKRSTFSRISGNAAERGKITYKFVNQ